MTDIQMENKSSTRKSICAVLSTFSAIKSLSIIEIGRDLICLDRCFFLIILNRNFRCVQTKVTGALQFYVLAKFCRFWAALVFENS